MLCNGGTAFLKFMLVCYLSFSDAKSHTELLCTPTIGQELGAPHVGNHRFSKTSVYVYDFDNQFQTLLDVEVLLVISAGGCGVN